MPALPPDDDPLRQLREAVAQLGERMRRLESRLERLETEKTPSPQTPITPTPTPARPAEPPLEAELVEVAAGPAPEVMGQPDVRPYYAPAENTPRRAAPPVPPPRVSLPTGLLPDGMSWESLVGGRWMTWLGAFTLIVAMAFFIPWAWQYFELPAWSRVLIFHLVGLALLVVAHLLDRRGLPVLARGIAGLGIFTLYACAYAAQHLYEIWGSHGETITFIECSVITLIAITIAVRTRSVAVILLGALGGYLTPIIASSGSGNHYALFSFLAFLNVALIASAVLRSWSFLKPLVLLATAAMFAAWLGSGHMDDTKVWSTEWFAVLHSVIFLAGTTIPPVLWRRTSTSFDLFALAGGSLWFVGTTWLLFHERPEQQLALVCWGMSALHAVLFVATYARVTNVDRMPRVQLALAALFFTLAAPLQLENSLNYLAVTWAAQGLIFTAVGVYFRDRQLCLTAVVVFSLALVRLFLFDYTAPPELVGAMQIDRRLLMFLCSASTMIAAGSLYWAIGRAVAEDPDEPVFWSPAGAGLIAVGNAIALIGLTCQWDSRLILLLWTIDVAAIWFAGFFWDNVWVRTYALALALGMVGGRALYHGDDLDGAYRLVANDRFGTLALLAALYFAAGWFYRRLRQTRQRAGESALTVFTGEGQVDLMLGVVANVVLVTAISLEIRSWYDWADRSGYAPFPDMEMARMATYSIVWASYAAIVVAAGFWLRYRLFRILGLVAFLPILAKVFLVDLAFLELLPRVLALAVLGVMLLAVSFLYQKFTARLEAEDRENNVF